MQICPTWLLSRQAATSLRASQDLLDTHRSPDFVWRSPDAWLVDDIKPQAAAMESLAGFLRAIAGSGQALALRAREVDRGIDCSDVLDTAAVRLAAASLSNYARGLGGVPALDELRAVRNVRGSRPGTNPGGVAVNAMYELRQTAWEHARSGHISIRVVALYAGLATSVYQHAAVIVAAGAAQAARLGLGADPTATAAQLHHKSRLLIEAANAWRDVRCKCAGLTSTAVPDPAIYELVLAVRGDLEGITRESDGWRSAGAIIPDREAMQTVFTEIGYLSCSAGGNIGVARKGGRSSRRGGAAVHVGERPRP